MPSERFYRLSEEKRKMICEAAIKEFARVTIDKVSINQIIKNANISRGSFYTYFEDKWDVLAYIFEDSRQKFVALMKLSLENNEGNLWMAFQDVMEAMLSFCSKRSNFEFLKNIMAHVNSDDMLRGFSKKGGDYTRLPGCAEQWVYEHMDSKNLKTKSFEEFHCLFTLGMSSVGIAIREFTREPRRMKLGSICRENRASEIRSLPWQRPLERSWHKHGI